ncbi:MAG: 1-acyl-sn-glycerol-3-phosphate acyltransferase [Nocardioides sp.]|nr:1-acyl-sn-glycerol-3-phosphate acyltransferase [Nocardioides sp.]
MSRRARHRERPRSDGAPRLVRWLLHGGRPTSRWLIRRWYDVRVHGAEHVPTSGPVVLASNHVGVIDGPLLAIFSPRPAHALTKIEMFSGFLGWFLTRCGQIPLDRFRHDPRAVRTSIRALRDGRVVGIFPEGQRGAGELELFHRGAAYLALVTGAPVVPVTMLGTREPGGHMGSLPKRGSRVDLVYGEPFVVAPAAWPRTRRQVGETSRVLRARMLVHLEESQRRLGRSLPGPLPAGEHEPDPGGGVTEKSA